MNNRFLRSITFMVMLIMLLSLITACGSSQTQQSSQQQEQQSEQQQSAQEAGQVKIGVVIKALNSDYWNIVRAGAEKAGSDLGISVDVLGPNAETDVAGQISMIEDEITKNVSALAVAPSQPSSAIPAFDKAKSAGIPVILIDTDADWPDKVSFVGTGNFAGGQQAGQFISDKLGKGGKVVIIRGALGDPTHDERTNGAKEVMEKNGLEILDIQPANSDRNMGMSVMENLLQSHSDIQAVFGTNDEMVLGAIRALEAAKKTDVITVGFDASPDALKAIKEGTMTASIAQSPYNIGYMGVEAAYKAAKGETVEKRIDTGTKVVTAENVDEEQENLNKILGK